MAFSGLGLSGGTNNTVEVYDLKNAGVGWSSPVSAPFSPPLYPKMFRLPNGKVFYTGQGSGRSLNGWIFDPGPKTWAQSVATSRDRHYGSAVLLPLLPPSYTPKVMNFGGGGNPAKYYRDHRSLSCLAELETRARYVNRAHPDERHHST